MIRRKKDEVLKHLPKKLRQQVNGAQGGRPITVHQ
jgi:hypothetical protein